MRPLYQSVSVRTYIIQLDGRVGVEFPVEENHHIEQRHYNADRPQPDVGLVLQEQVYQPDSSSDDFYNQIYGHILTFLKTSGKVIQNPKTEAINVSMFIKNSVDDGKMTINCYFCKFE